MSTIRRRLGGLLTTTAAAVSMFLIPGSAEASVLACDYGTNFQVRIQFCHIGGRIFDGEGLNIGDGFYGHIDVWGPGIARHHDGDRFRPNNTVRGEGSGYLCAEGWRRNNDGSWSSVGLPCVFVP
jgi:hypothetical protein